MWTCHVRRLRHKKIPSFESECCRKVFISSLPKDVSQTIPSAYTPDQVESGWYTWWDQNNFFKPNDRSEAKFSMALPPPNVTGTLHLGHALTCAIQDSLVRWNRMNGKSALWIPGSDHAGIATQVVVEKHLAKKGIRRSDLSREEFLQTVWQWKEEKGDIIFDQLKRMGASLDWSRATFTLDPKMSHAVREAFIRLHDSGKIYRKERLVNWCCHLKSAISDIEVDHREITQSTLVSVPGYKDPVMFGQLYTLAYKVYEDRLTEREVLVSTTRPETLFGDTAIAVNPQDPRHSDLIGKFVWHPLRQKTIPVVGDESVDPEFATGAMKVTPAHDVKDFEVGERHGLDKVNIMDNDGILNDNCGEYKGIPRLEARHLVVQRLMEENLLRRVQEHPMSVPVCSRSGDVIEPLLRPQWFVDCKSMASRALKAVETGELKIVPNNFEKTWFDWLENIRDWCISRQLWWGHRIPAYLCTDKDGKQRWIAAHDEEDARRRAVDLYGFAAVEDVKQDDDVLDTWFSSSLVPFSVYGWPNQQSVDLQKYFPLNLMETGHDILFFWVARMVMMSLELNNTLPFKEILLHGIICDSQGRKMSKSLGNVIDPVEVIRGTSLKEMEDQLKQSVQIGHLTAAECEKAAEEKRKMYPEGIPQIGADALRFTLCSYNVKNHFINLDVSTMRTHRLFCNKIWQATRFLFSLMDRLDLGAVHREPLTARELQVIDRWVLSRLSRMVETIDASMATYDFHVATEAIYSFFYGNLCDVYLEAIKNVDEKKQKKSALVLLYCFDAVLRAMAPFMPYLSEELYQRLKYRCQQNQLDFCTEESVVIAPYPTPEVHKKWEDQHVENIVSVVLDAIREIRAIKTEYGISKTKPKGLLVSSVLPVEDADQLSKLVSHLGGLSSMHIRTDPLESLQAAGGSCVTRTFANNAVIQLDLAGVLDPQVELKKTADKVKKVTESLNKLRKTVAAPGYAKSAPTHVQEAHRNKIALLENEIQQLEEYKSLVQRITT